MTVVIDGTTGIDAVQNNTVAFSDLLATDWSNLLGANGYQKLPSGLIIQWGIGTASSAASGTSTTITLPIAYSVAQYVALAVNTGAVAGNSTYNTTAITTSSFTVQRGNAGNLESGTSFYWISLGK